MSLGSLRERAYLPVCPSQSACPPCVCLPASDPVLLPCTPTAYVDSLHCLAHPRCCQDPAPYPAINPALRITPDYLGDLIKANMGTLCDAVEDDLRSIPAVGNIIKLDHGHRNAKYVRVPDRTRAMEGTLTVQNGRLEIMGSWHGPSGLKPYVLPLALMAERSKELGYPVGWLL